VPDRQLRDPIADFFQKRTVVDANRRSAPLGLDADLVEA